MKNGNNYGKCMSKGENMEIIRIIVREGMDVRLRKVIRNLRTTETPDEVINQVKSLFFEIQEELMAAHEQLVQKDYDLKNAQNKLKELENVKRQNEHLKAICAEEWKEMGV